MKIRWLTRAFTCALCLLSLSCHPRADAKRDNPVQGSNNQESTPVLEIKVGERFILSERLGFDWKISNSGSKPIYVLSTMLEPQNNDFAEIAIDPNEKILGVGFLRSIEAVGFPPYSFPKLQFKQIDPGTSLAGSFVSDVAIGQLKDYKLVGTKLDELRIMPGTWKVRAAIAYGYELQPVQTAVKETLNAGQEHPINAVVRWQRVQYSDPIIIRVQN